MPARPGAFTANFAPETLDKFRDTCKKNGLQYTKVLEELAELFLSSKGYVLEFNALVENTENMVAASAQIDDTTRRFLKEKGLLDEYDDYLHDNLKDNDELKNFQSGLEESKKLDAEKLKKLMDKDYWFRMKEMQKYYPKEEMEKWEEGYAANHYRNKVLKEFASHNRRILFRILQELNLQHLAQESEETQKEKVYSDPILGQGKGKTTKTFPD